MLMLVFGIMFQSFLSYMHRSQAIFLLVQYTIHYSPQFLIYETTPVNDYEHENLVQMHGDIGT